MDGILNRVTKTVKPTPEKGTTVTKARDLAHIAEGIFHEALTDCVVGRAFQASTIDANLNGVRRLLVIAAGKAGTSMLEGLLRHVVLPSDCELSGVLIAPQRPEWIPQGIQFFAGGHPLPTAESVAGALAALAAVEQAYETKASVPTFCFFLFSGGASSMMELPLDSSVSLDDIVDLYRALVHSGASIAEINCVRKHVSAVKGGRLGLAAATMSNLTLLVSDVPETQLDSLASGPTMPDSSTITDCREILLRYDLSEHLPASIRRLLDSPNLPETPKPGAFPSRIITLLSSNDLCLAAKRHATSLGFKVVIDNTCDEWDYQVAANYLLERLRSLRKVHPRICLLSAGEVSVRVDVQPAEAPAIGGRNQHFALYAATRLTPEDGGTAILSAGSDGIDGNSRFAGAALTYDILRGARSTQPAQHIEPMAAALSALKRFDSSTLLSQLGATIATGPTGNNLRDLRILISE
jgi:hydroxypyruvate reductase